MWYPYVALIARVDVEERDLPGAEKHRDLGGQVHQEPGRDGVELADIAERERPQERPERGGVGGVIAS